MRIRKSLGDLDSAAFTLFGIANLYWARPHYPIPGIGDPHRAIEYAEQAVALTPQKSNKATFLGQLSSWYAILGDVQRAIQYSDLAASYDKRYDFDRAERMRYIREFAQQGYI